MVPLNVDIPADVMQMLRVAKAVTGEPIRTIVLSALIAAMKQRGVNKDAVNKLAKPQK